VSGGVAGLAGSILGGPRRQSQHLIGLRSVRLHALPDERLGPDPWAPWRPRARRPNPDPISRPGQAHRADSPYPAYQYTI
jgi:hypothetical protein